MTASQKNTLNSLVLSRNVTHSISHKRIPSSGGGDSDLKTMMDTKCMKNLLSLFLNALNCARFSLLECDINKDIYKTLETYRSSIFHIAFVFGLNLIRLSINNPFTLAVTPHQDRATNKIRLIEVLYAHSYASMSTVLT